ncbi:MAG TPA: hypothetical protein VG056_02855 [Pirellulales bacterium]|jgi:hypothetical protein|nr:hypothetical protein [Pirellulales bacterium]
MRKSTFAIALVLFAVVLWFGLEGKPPRAAGTEPTPHRFEYSIGTFGDLTENNRKGLKDLGDNGWEMCGVASSGEPKNALVIFKRPKW